MKTKKKLPIDTSSQLKKKDRDKPSGLKAKRKDASDLAKSIRKLAKMVGRSDTAIRKWLKRPDWPFADRPPWDAKKVKAWAEINLKPDPAGIYQRKVASAQAGTGEYAEIGALTRAKIQVTLERALYIRQRRLFEGKKLLDAGEVQRQWLAHIQSVKSQLTALPRSIALELLNRSNRDEIEQLLQSRLTEILNGLTEEKTKEPAIKEGNDKNDQSDSSNS